MSALRWKTFCKGWCCLQRLAVGLQSLTQEAQSASSRWLWLSSAAPPHCFLMSPPLDWWARQSQMQTSHPFLIASEHIQSLTSLSFVHAEVSQQLPGWDLPNLISLQSIKNSHSWWLEANTAVQHTLAVPGIGTGNKSQMIYELIEQCRSYGKDWQMFESLVQDPLARLAMWDSITHATQVQGRLSSSCQSNERDIEEGMPASLTSILTTHSMDEAEALCNRIAILSRGKLICVGTPLDLKRRYCPYVTLQVWPSDSCYEQQSCFHLIRLWLTSSV